MAIAVCKGWVFFEFRSDFWLIAEDDDFGIGVDLFEISTEQGFLLKVADDEGTDKLFIFGVVVQIVIAETVYGMVF